MYFGQNHYNLSQYIFKKKNALIHTHIYIYSNNNANAYLTWFAFSVKIIAWLPKEKVYIVQSINGFNFYYFGKQYCHTGSTTLPGKKLF